MPQAAPSGPAAAREGALLLLAVTLIWGSTFVVIKDTVASLPANSLVLLRFALAGLAFLPFARPGRRLWPAGLELGLWLWIGYTSQAAGLAFTTASRSAFITALSVVLVPVLAALAGRRPARRIWLAAGMAWAGVALLVWDGAPPNRGDLLTLVTALSYAIYVLRLEQWAASFPARPLAAAQIWGVLPFALAWAAWQAGGGAGAAADLAATLELALVRVFELVAGLPAATWRSILYLALAATALTTWMQSVGQQRVRAAQAAIIFASEPIWAALFAALWLGETFGARGWLGAALILVAILISQLPLKVRRP